MEEVPASPNAKQWKRIAGYTVFWGPLLVLLGLYVLVGDTSPLGEYFTIWPPMLWVFALIPLAMTQHRQGQWRPMVAALLGIVAFLLLTEEWRSLVRFGSGERPRSDLRVISWNVSDAGADQLQPILDLYNADVVFLQEAPGDLESSGVFGEYHILDDGDCATLSRYPVRQLRTERIGPWAPPQVLAADLPGSRTVLLCNVRLMLPSLVLNPIGNWGRLSTDNRARVAQFPQLIRLLSIQSAELGGAPIVLAGDFNTPATAKSLGPLRDDLADAWREAGRGWGRTITVDFPVSRIDQCWTSEDIQAMDACVLPQDISDHRMLLVDLALPPGEE